MGKRSALIISLHLPALPPGYPLPLPNTLPQRPIGGFQRTGIIRSLSTKLQKRLHHPVISHLRVKHYAETKIMRIADRLDTRGRDCKYLPSRGRFAEGRVEFIGLEGGGKRQEWVRNYDMDLCHPYLAPLPHQSTEYSAEDLHPCADSKDWYRNFPEPGEPFHLLQEAIVFQCRPANDDTIDTIPIRVIHTAIVQADP